ncbi:hypothetical protein BDZ91DRAFT_740596 [Kalaharituber pfeilii]|nr:hypothetical protein BDZ91DRAFT_740596 [Kalaharituber pfeilii]
MATKSPTHGPTNLKFLHTDCFKIVLKDVIAESNLEATTSSTSAKQAEPTDSNGGIPDEAVFYVHRSVLASLSAELDKHVNNDMKEGTQGVMELSDVDRVTMTAFLGWAYRFTDGYTIENPNAASALLAHTKMYVLADRFNIVSLKGLAYNNITALLVNIGMVTNTGNVEAVMAAVSYAFGNLPFRSFSSSSTAAPEEQLLKYFAQYVSWALDTFRANPEFHSLLEHSSDFAKALISHSRSAISPPWRATTTGTGVANTPRCASCRNISVFLHCRQCCRNDGKTADRKKEDSPCFRLYRYSRAALCAMARLGCRFCLFFVFLYHYSRAALCAMARLGFRFVFICCFIIFILYLVIRTTELPSEKIWGKFDDGWKTGIRVWERRLEQGG